MNSNTQYYIFNFESPIEQHHSSHSNYYTFFLINKLHKHLIIHKPTSKASESLLIGKNEEQKKYCSTISHLELTTQIRTSRKGIHHVEIQDKLLQWSVIKVPDGGYSLINLSNIKNYKVKSVRCDVSHATVERDITTK